MISLKSIFLTVAAAATLSACSYPTEVAQTVDSRPQVTFKTALNANRMALSVDGLPAGHVSDYLAGKAALRVLPGTHVIDVVKPDGARFQERIYVGDGVTKTVVIQ